MTQSLEGATVLAPLAPSSGDAWLPAPCPDGPVSDPGRSCQASGALAPGPPPNPSAPLRSANISCPHPHQELPSWRELVAQPAQCSQLPQLSSPGAGERPRLVAEQAIGETQAPAPVGSPSVSPELGRGGGQLAGCPRPCSLPRRYLLACGGVPGLPASPAAVSPRSCPCWLLSQSPCTGGGEVVGCSALLPRTAASRVNGSGRPASGAPRSPPGGALSPGAGSAKTLRARGEREVADSLAQSQVAGPGGPATVPGRRPAPLERRREGAGTAAATPGRSGLQAGAGPLEPVTHLPNPAPGRPRSLPPACGARAAATTRPRCACDRQHRPLGLGLIFSLASPVVRTAPLPTQPGARPAARLPGSRAGNYSPSMASGCVPSSRLPSRCRRPIPGPAPPWNCLARSR